MLTRPRTAEETLADIACVLRVARANRTVWCFRYLLDTIDRIGELLDAPREQPAPDMPPGIPAAQEE